MRTGSMVMTLATICLASAVKGRPDPVTSWSPCFLRSSSRTWPNKLFGTLGHGHADTSDATRAAHLMLPGYFQPWIDLPLYRLDWLRSSQAPLTNFAVV